MLSLRRILTLTALLLGVLPALLGGAAIRIWLMPRLEQEAVAANTALARTLAQQTGLYLQGPLDALSFGANELRAQHRSRLTPQELLDWLMASNKVFQAVYLVDAERRITHVSLRSNSSLQPADLIGLDLSRLHMLSREPPPADDRWSDVFLSSISGMPAVAATARIGSATVIGEISLAELSSFVRDAAVRESTRMIIMDEHGQIIADPDPAIAQTYLNRSPISLFAAARTGGAASGRFRMDDIDHIGSALRVDPQGWVVLVAEPSRQALLSGWQSLGLLAVIGMSMLILTLGLALLCASWLARRTEMLAQIAAHATQQNFDFIWPKSRVLEYSQLLGSLRQMFDTLRAREQALSDANELLEERIQERTHALSDANEELSVTIESLQHARNELSRAERQAALGRLVAGVAHELNTPIGNSLILATTLQDQAHEFSAAIDTGLTRRALEHYRAQCKEATELIARNLHKAAELIQDFKQIAVDQSTAQRRQFNLAEMLSEINRLLAPGLRRSPLSLRIDVADDIVMNSYPGPLGQVLSNLLQNALLHAYADQDGGEVQVLVELTGEERLRISVSDQGTGIPADILPRIFDPFFTTRMGQGGTGLGLHIAHQIVTELLGGSIEVQSTPGQGSCFILNLPRVAPGALTEAEKGG